VRSAHINIGKRLVDEAMRLLQSTATGACHVTVCKCAMSAAIQKVIIEFKENRPSGMVRFVFLVNKETITILVNADRLIKNYRLTHVQA
jgi:hypothetical protein